MRNSSGLVVQFRYGDDGLDPANMEDVDRPMDFMRVLTHCQVRLLAMYAPLPVQNGVTDTADDARALAPRLSGSPWTRTS